MRRKTTIKSYPRWRIDYDSKARRWNLWIMRCPHEKVNIDSSMEHRWLAVPTESAASRLERIDNPRQLMLVLG